MVLATQDCGSDTTLLPSRSVPYGDLELVMATYGVTPEDGGLQGLMDASPDREVHTSVAAETAFILGLVALVATPFSVMHALSMATGVLGIMFGFVGMATTSRPNVAGRVIAPLGLLFGCTALVVVGLRYLGVDTAFGDDLVPTLRAWMENLNSRIPLP